MANNQPCNDLWEIQAVVPARRGRRSREFVELPISKAQKTKATSKSLRKFKKFTDLWNIDWEAQYKFDRDDDPYTRFVDGFIVANAENELGRGVFAQTNLPFDEVVLREKPFAAVIQANDACMVCVKCHSTKSHGFIPCGGCGIVYYCCESCKNDHKAHQYSCGTFFEHIDDLDIKLTMQMVFETMAIFKSVKSLTDHINKLVNNKDMTGAPDVRDDSPQTKFNCIMHLQRAEMQNDTCEQADLAYNLLSQFDTVKTFFETETDMGMLRHLVAHFYGIQINNAYEDQINVKSGRTSKPHKLYRQMIYGIGSYFNHSCAPNLIRRTIGNELAVKTLRHIRSGEQLFISYEFFKTESRKVRRSFLNETWHFNCNCTRCKLVDITKVEQKKANNMGKAKLQKILGDLKRTEQNITTQDIAYMLRYYTLALRTHEF